jgi:uncharacterized FlgJ-related protein
MFSINIINSARFIKLPIDAQNLYFHLGLRADDDGIVEAFPVMRMIGSNDDNLKLLHVKQFVRILNDDLVSYITDWKEHNNIRSDRKIDSIYKDLLVEILPEIKLLEATQRVDVKDNSNRVKNITMDSPWTDNGQSVDGIGKDRLGKVSLGKDKKPKEKAPSIVDQYTSNINLKDAIQEFVKMRTKIRASMTDRAIQLMLLKLDSLASTDELKIKILNQSIENSWKGIFEVKQNKTKDRYQEVSSDDIQ